MDDDDSPNVLTSFLLTCGWLFLFLGTVATALVAAMHLSSRWLDESMVPSMGTWSVGLTAFTVGYLLYQTGRRSRHFAGRRGELARLGGERWFGPLPWRKGEVLHLAGRVVWRGALTVSGVGGIGLLLGFPPNLGSHLFVTLGMSILGVGLALLLLGYWLRVVEAEKR